MNDIDKASQEARAVTKGLKKKEMDDLTYQIAIFFSILASIVVGFIFKSWILGIIALVVLAGISAKNWYKE